LAASRAALSAAVAANLALTVYHREGLALVKTAATAIGVHVKVDTGMHRLGAGPDDAVTLAKEVAADGHLRLVRTVKFKGFMPGVELVLRIASIAEAEAHHPDLLLAYGSLTIQLWTHAAGGLTDNDFILAARLEPAISQSLN
jgi:pterin-4a-carbinolamine dehydratase